MIWSDKVIEVTWLDDGCVTEGAEYSVEEEQLLENRSNVQKTATRAVLILKNSSGYVLALAVIIFLVLRLWLGRKQFGTSITGLIKVRSTPGSQRRGTPDQELVEELSENPAFKGSSRSIKKKTNGSVYQSNPLAEVSFADEEQPASSNDETDDEDSEDESVSSV
eukprot:COSAG02_NODE_20900_length_811_cov_1.063202_2_plen_164_part_01